MGKEQLLPEIQRLEKQLDACGQELRTLEAKLNALDEFTNNAGPCVTAFEDSIRRRKEKLQTFVEMAGRVLAAKRYHAKMSEALTGADYQTAVRSIEEMQEQVSRHRGIVIRDINDAESRKARIRAQLNELRYQYNHYPEEDNGE